MSALVTVKPVPWSVEGFANLDGDGRVALRLSGDQRRNGYTLDEARALIASLEVAVAEAEEAEWLAVDARQVTP